MLRFDLAEVRRVVAHVQAAHEHRAYFSEKLGPRVYLVKDEGIYLMSSGMPRDLADPNSTDPRAESFVAYAKGYDPHTGDRSAIWEKCREAVGGDDFGEPLDLDDFVSALAAPNIKGLLIKVTPNHISLVIEERVPKRQVH